MEAGGVAALEVVARDLMALGLYQARALSYDGVEVDILEHPLAGHVPTALIALDLDDALTICDKLNRRLGFTREQWTALAAQSMRTETREPGDPAEH